MSLGLASSPPAIRDSTRRMMEEHVRPRIDELERRGGFPAELLPVFRGNDVFRSTVPREYGGLDGGLLTICLVLEEMGRVHASSSMVVGNQYLGAGPIALFAGDEQKERWLPGLASGELLGSFALTEPEAGSDAGGMQARAVRDGDGWRISGRKVFITNADVADILTVFAKADGSDRRSVTAFVLERGEHDWVVDGVEKKMGLRASSTCSLVVDDVWVPDANRIGEIGDGMRIALGCLNKGRVSTASQAVGIAQGALEIAIDHASTATAGEGLAWESQAIQFAVAEMETDVEAARALVRAAAARYDAGDADIIRYSAITKLYATDMVNRVTGRVVELLSDAGRTRREAAERMFRDCRVYAIFEGTNEIQKIVIARELRKRL
jgi:alkylation response protein AidB-like acyl-CoA dehydrogenase